MSILKTLTNVAKWFERMIELCIPLLLLLG